MHNLTNPAVMTLNLLVLERITPAFFFLPSASLTDEKKSNGQSQRQTSLGGHDSEWLEHVMSGAGGTELSLGQDFRGEVIFGSQALVSNPCHQRMRVSCALDPA